MAKIPAVYDASPAFGERLADYVNQREKIPFIAMASSNLDRLREYGEEHPIEILPIDECSRALVGNVKAGQVMILCNGELVDGLDAPPPIYKYQPGDCIMREVPASHCSRPAEPPLVLLRTRALVMGIYSLVSRYFESSLALTIGQVMAKKETALYLNPEGYSGLSGLINNECKADLSDVLYLRRQGEYNWVKSESMTSNWGNMDYVSPVRYVEDLDQVAPEGMMQLINRIVRESGYDRLVVGVDRMGRGSFPALSMYGMVYMPIREDYISAVRIEEFEEYPREAGDAGVRDKIQELRLPRYTGIIRQEGYLEQLTWGEMGDYVRQFLDGKQPES